MSKSLFNPENTQRLLIAGTTVAGAIAASVYLSANGKPEVVSPPSDTKGLIDIKELGEATRIKQDVKRLPDGSTLIRPYVNNPENELVDYTKLKGKAINTGPRDTALDRLSKAGVSSLAPTTVIDRFKVAVRRHGNNTAFVSATDRKYTWQQYYDETMVIAKSLLKVGVDVGGAVNVIGFNSPEWLIMNMAAIAAGAKAAGIYTTNGPEACKYISKHSEATVVCCQDEVHLAKFLEIRDELPKLKAIVMYEGDSLPTGCNDGNPKARVYTWKEFLAIGEQADSSCDQLLEKRIADQKPGDPCTLIYTSGTTGNPKAVMLSHDNVTWVAVSLYCQLGPDFGTPDRPDGEHLVSYLPLSHIAAQILDVFVPLTTASVIGANCTVWFADKNALKGSLLQYLQKARPTVFFGVPRVWEKFSEAMKKKGAANTGLKKTLIAWAKAKGSEYFEQIQNQGKGEAPWGFTLANILLKKVRVQIGLDRCKFCFTGAAPIGRETLNFFGALNIPVLELYGMSECAGPHTVSHLFNKGFEVGKCGPPLAGCEMKLQHEEGRDPVLEGEICYRGRHVMMGYMNDPEKTEAAIDEDGWLHSGDVGSVDEHGLLKITGRIKELLITAGGENVAPVPIEDVIKGECPGLSNCMLIGDKKKYLSCIVTLKCEPNADGTFSDQLAGEALDVSPGVTTVAEAQKDPKWQKYIQSGLDHYNQSHAISRATHVQYFRVLDNDFSVPGGELGPTLKLKRSVVTKKYDEVIESMY